MVSENDILYCLPDKGWVRLDSGKDGETLDEGPDFDLFYEQLLGLLALE